MKPHRDVTRNAVSADDDVSPPPPFLSRRRPLASTSNLFEGERNALISFVSEIERQAVCHKREAADEKHSC